MRFYEFFFSVSYFFEYTDSGSSLSAVVRTNFFFCANRAHVYDCKYALMSRDVLSIRAHLAAKIFRRVVRSLPNVTVVSDGSHALLRLATRHLTRELYRVSPRKTKKIVFGFVIFSSFNILFFRKIYLKQLIANRVFAPI